jgi:hypothetical protein
LVVTNLTVNGNISASGQSPLASYEAGGGSGGSVSRFSFNLQLKEEKMF